VTKHPGNTGCLMNAISRESSFQREAFIVIVSCMANILVMFLTIIMLLEAVTYSSIQAPGLLGRVNWVSVLHEETCLRCSAGSRPDARAKY